LKTALENWKVINMTIKLLRSTIEGGIDPEIFANILRVAADGHSQLVVDTNPETIATQVRSLVASLDVITGGIGNCIVALLLAGDELPEPLEEFPQKICDRINQHSQGQQ
jgi:hypothetical protein